MYSMPHMEDVGYAKNRRKVLQHPMNAKLIVNRLLRWQVTAVWHCLQAVLPKLR